MNKRGAWTDHITGKLIEMVLVIAYIVVLTMIVRNMYENSMFERRIIAADSAILIDTLYASPGNVMQHYYNNWQGFMISFEQNQVVVYKSANSSLPGNEPRYRFGEDTQIPFQYSTFFAKGKKKEDFLIFLKTQNMLKPELNPEITQQDLKQTKDGSVVKGNGRTILIDTLENNDGEKSKTAMALTDYFQSVEATSYFTYIYAAKNEQERSIMLRNKPDFYIIFEPSIAVSDRFFVVVANKSSENFGLGIASKLSQLAEFNGVGFAIDENDAMLRRAPHAAARIMANGDFAKIQRNKDIIGKAAVAAIKGYNG
jgi:hypothetical protein